MSKATSKVQDRDRYPRDSTRGYRAKSATRARKAARTAKRTAQGRS